MHVQIVNFHLNGVTDADFRKEADQLAPVFAAVPGLISKVWLADAATNTYGGVYLWRDKQAMDAYAASDLFKAVVSNPAFAGVASRDYGVVESATAVTRGAETAPATA